MTTSQSNTPQYYVRNKDFFISGLEWIYLEDIKESLLSNVFDIKSHVLQDEKLQNAISGGDYYKNRYEKSHYSYRLGKIELLEQFNERPQLIDLDSKTPELDITITYFLALLRFYNNVKDDNLNAGQRKTLSSIGKSIQSITQSPLYKYISPLLQPPENGKMVIKPILSHEEVVFKHSTLKDLDEHFNLSSNGSTLHYGTLGSSMSDVLSSIKKINEFNENIYLCFSKLLPQIASACLEAINLFDSHVFYNTQNKSTKNKDISYPAVVNVGIYYPYLNKTVSYNHLLSHSIFKSLFAHLSNACLSPTPPSLSSLERNGLRIDGLSLKSRNTLTLDCSNLQLICQEEKEIEYDEYFVYIKSDKSNESGFLSHNYQLSGLWTEAKSFISKETALFAIQQYASYKNLNPHYINWQIVKAKMQVTSIIQPSPIASSGWAQVLDKKELEKSIHSPATDPESKPITPARKFKI